MSRITNPTGTTKLEKAYLREVRKRYSSLISAIKEKLRENTSPIATNTTIGMNAEQQRIFMAWLLGAIEEVTGEFENNWQQEYQLQAYIRALESTRASLVSQGADIVLTDQELIQAQGLSFTATATLGSQIVAPVIHQDALEFLFTRSYESLKGWNDTLAKEVRQITFDAVKNGTGITEITDRIVERAKVARSRAETIARTETISAYQQSTANETERASEELGKEVKLRWITALDGRVRHLHATFHGTIDTVQNTNKKRSISPFNCRCAQVPVIEGVNDTPAKNEKFNKQREQMIKAEDKRK